MPANYTDINEANAAVDSIHDQLVLALSTIQALKEELALGHSQHGQTIAANAASHTTSQARHHTLWGRVSAMAQNLDEATRAEFYALEQEARAFINQQSPVAVLLPPQSLSHL